MRQFYLLFPNSHALRDELSWTHYRLLLKVEDEHARTFYLNECAAEHWSTRQLDRQINSFYYQRMLKSQKPEAVRNEIYQLVPADEPRDFVRDPYVLEFLDIEPAEELYEKDLENALIIVVAIGTQSWATYGSPAQFARLCCLASNSPFSPR